MMDTVVELQSSLEAQVDARTKELESSRIQLLMRENLAALGRLAAGVAHEIGNPLTGISSIVQLVKRRKKDDVFVSEQLELVHAEIDRLARLSRQMVDLARPDNPQRTVFDVKEAARKAYQIARLDRKLKKRVVSIPNDEKPTFVEANEDALIQIVMNLLFNAADFTSDQGTIDITIDNGERQMVELRVIDNGSGIPDEAQNRIFDPFYSGKQPGSGTGLGLSVSHSLARSFHGELSLESSKQGRTVFLLRVPRRKSVVP
jgi:signal transduction histidine kinase